MSDLGGFRVRLLKALDPDTVRALGEGLKEASRFHSRWLGEFHKSIVCGTPFPDNARPADGQDHCVCGKWLAVIDTTPLTGDAEVEAFRRLHAAQHAGAADLVRCTKTGVPVSEAEYERFLDVHEAFQSKLNLLLYEVISTDLQFDPLTGTLGRSAMEEMVLREHRRAERTGVPACLAMGDLDRLKEVNDTFGHPFGDRVLSEVSDRFAAGLRSYDLLFRYGGDEFLICLPNSDMETAHRILERLRLSIESTPMETGCGHPVTPTASFGVTVLGGGSVEDCIERADQALYRAKRAGRNRVVEYTEEVRAE